MTDATKELPDRFARPWPSGQPTWADPPWLLSGRAITAWFELPQGVARQLLSPDLIVSEGATVRVRLRFYDLSFTAVERPPKDVALSDGRFREAALGVPACLGETRGETAVCLWSDSMTYAMWGREVYGWPILPAEISLCGSLWEKEIGVGATGSAEMHDEFGIARVSHAVIEDVFEPPVGAGPVWLTPRRIVHHAPDLRDEQQLLAVAPTIVDRGSWFHGSATVDFDFAPGHPLASCGSFEAQLEVNDGLRYVVAESVTVLSAS